MYKTRSSTAGVTVIVCALLVATAVQADRSIRASRRATVVKGEEEPLRSDADFEEI